jgi:hypothetical protein
MIDEYTSALSALDLGTLQVVGVLHATAGEQAVLAKVVLGQMSAWPNAAYQSSGLDIQKVVLRTDPDITWIEIIHTLCGYELLPRRPEKHNSHPDRIIIYS